MQETEAVVRVVRSIEFLACVCVCRRSVQDGFPLWAYEAGQERVVPGRSMAASIPRVEISVACLELA